MGSSEEAVQIKTAESESRLNWNLISKVRKARNGLLFYPNDSLFYWVPVTAFASEDDRTRLEALFLSKVKDVAEIR
jgi:hypothetical protein